MTAVTEPGATPAPETSGPSKAGRNLPAAIGVGLSLGGSILASVYSPYRWTFIVILLAAAGLGSWEVVRALRTLGTRPPVVPVWIGGAGMIVAAYRYGEEQLFLGLALTLLLLVLWRVGDPAEGVLRDLTSGLFTAAYVPFLIGFAALMIAADDGPERITAFVATVVASDVGGYAAGVLFGKHPMAPSVSPKKSWEGLAGSVLACAAAGAVFFVTLFDASPLLGVAYGVAVVASATLGDLGESMIKRDIGIKDMGTLLPGHGGLMDRLDSLLPTAPIAYLLLVAFL